MNMNMEMFIEINTQIHIMDTEINLRISPAHFFLLVKEGNSAEEENSDPLCQVYRTWPI